ncbi:hypothetical protein K503DRAFT_777566 [Rhizopogon vinicolor AM-OR11-026]|uniref:Uncharacterized protein n=1 Tax=Rhizopogon vinicolor AM-OR11-026 TaxID=1314800 RepID=A0A1B7MFS5_9AGAM|nr:hypothetical protein K503DRAFT_777566 [Rhizopogon vinicolor AM-OR11-026]
MMEPSTRNRFAAALPFSQAGGLEVVGIGAWLVVVCALTVALVEGTADTSSTVVSLLRKWNLLGGSWPLDRVLLVGLSYDAQESGHTVILMQDFAAVTAHTVMQQSCGAYVMYH